MTTEIGRVKCWISTERLRQQEVLGRETGMVYNVKTTTTTQQPFVQRIPFSLLRSSGNKDRLLSAQGYPCSVVTSRAAKTGRMLEFPLDTRNIKGLHTHTHTHTHNTRCDLPPKDKCLPWKLFDDAQIFSVTPCLSYIVSSHLSTKKRSAPQC